MKKLTSGSDSVCIVLATQGVKMEILAYNIFPNTPAECAMSFWGWCLALLLIVACLGGLVYWLWAFISFPLMLLLEAWEKRRDLNPQTSQGRWRLLGIGIYGLVAAIALYFVELLRSRSRLPLIIFPVLLAFAILLTFIALRSLGRAKRFEASTGERVLVEDRRPPVVYLRSFKDDARAANRVGMASFRVNTEEGELADLVKHIGPLVAIGQPGEELPFFGAARVYVGQDEWQKRVRQLLSNAPMVILRAGSTAGLGWEVEQCASHVMPQRLVVLVPLKRSDYEEFQGKVQGFFPCRLPEYKGRWLGATTLRAVLYFDDDWTPHMDPVLKNGYMSNFLHEVTEEGDVFTKEKSTMRRVLEDLLKPVLQRAS